MMGKIFSLSLGYCIHVHCRNADSTLCFSNVYLDALNYLKENQDSIYDYTCIKEEERKWMDSLIEDPGAVNFHVSYF